MSPIGETLVLAGLLQLDGGALADQRVLLISEDTTALLASAATDERGRFELAVPREHSGGRVVLLAKLQGPVVAVKHAVVDLRAGRPGPQEFHFDSTAAEFHAVRGRVETTSGWPPYLMLFVDPVRIEGVPEPLAGFFNQRDENVLESYFFRTRVDGAEFSLRLQRGTYRIGADYLDRSRPNIVDPQFENYVAARVETDGEPEPLPGKRYSGYLLKVDRDRAVTMTIEVVPDEELSP